MTILRINKKFLDFFTSFIEFWDFFRLAKHFLRCISIKSTNHIQHFIFSTSQNHKRGKSYRNQNIAGTNIFFFTHNDKKFNLIFKQSLLKSFLHVSKIQLKSFLRASRKFFLYLCKSSLLQSASIIKLLYVKEWKL